MVPLFGSFIAPRGSSMCRVDPKIVAIFLWCDNTYASKGFDATSTHSLPLSGIPKDSSNVRSIKSVPQREVITSPKIQRLRLGRKTGMNSPTMQLQQTDNLCGTSERVSEFVGGRGCEDSG